MVGLVYQVVKICLHFVRFSFEWLSVTLPSKAFNLVVLLFWTCA